MIQKREFMKFSELIQKRQSVRAYEPTPVEREKIERCVEAARLAPSASNSQPWHFIIVDEPELKNKLAKFAKAKYLKMNMFAEQAPVIVVIVTEKSKLITQIGSRLKDKQYNQIDIGIAAEHFCLQATEENLGTCILGWFDEKNIKKLLNIPKQKRLHLLITVGYAKKGYKQRQKIRKKLNEIICYNAYK